MLIDRLSSRLPFHYAWIIVATGTVCIFSALGLGRFALGMLLPSMAVTLDLTYSQMGLISTANFVGYLAAVLFGGFIATRTGVRKLIFVAMLLVGISMALISRANSYSAVLVMYTLTGVGSGASNVPMMGLVSRWFARKNRGRAAGFIVIGSGLAIILSGRLIPVINEIIGREGWRVNWLILGTVSIVVSFICLILLRDRPEDIGLMPAGSEAAGSFSPSGADRKTSGIYREKAIYLLGLIYFLFGYTYVIYATFIVTSLVQERGFSESVAGNFWAWVGGLSLFSGPIFGTLSDRFGRKAGLITVFAFQTLAYLLVAFKLPIGFLYLSIFCFGIVAWSIPSIIVAAVSDYVGASNAVAAFGFVTFIFGLGQITGPAVAGIMAERAGSFSGSFLMAGSLTGIAILLTSFLKSPNR